MTRLAVMGLVLAGIGGCTLPERAEPALFRVEPANGPDDIETGTASWYGADFAGEPTASGEPFDPQALTAAHPDLPFGTEITVTHIENERSVTVTINDRGPFVDERIIDLSRAAAATLGFVDDGTAEVRLEVDQSP